MKNTQTDVSKIIFILVLTAIFIAGCVSPSQPTTKPADTNSATTTNMAPFISAANKCEDASILFTDEVATFNYLSSKCVFTKALVTLNADETDEMKNLLEGKNMTCRYEIGKFDERLVNSMIFGMEYCKGDLKEALAGLIVFA